MARTIVGAKGVVIRLRVVGRVQFIGYGSRWGREAPPSTLNSNEIPRVDWVMLT